MKIKRYILYIVLAFGAVSCASDDVKPLMESQGTPVEFGIYNTATRAKSLADADVRNAGIGLFAIHQGVYGIADYLESKQEYSPNFMYNQKLEYISSNWIYSPIKYWPNNYGDKVSFYAYAPFKANLGTDNVVTPDNNLMLQDVVPVDGYRLQLGYDHMGPGIEYFMSDDPTKGVDLMWGSKGATATSPVDMTKPGIGEKIQFKMHHAMSRMDFDVQVWTDAVATSGTNNAIPAGTTVNIKSVTLKGNFARRGTLRLYDGTWNIYPGAYHNMAFKADKDHFGDVVKNGLDGNDTKSGAVPLLKGTSFGADKNNYIMAIPGARFYFEIVYDVTTVDNVNPENTSTITNTVRSTDGNAGHPGSTDGWYTIEQGKAYVYHLTIGLTSVNFDAAFTDWVDKPQTDINLP